MKSKAVACPYCGAAPTEDCRRVRVPENARTTRTEYGNYGHAHIKRPHQERVYAAKEDAARER